MNMKTLKLKLKLKLNQTEGNSRKISGDNRAHNDNMNAIQ